MGSERRTTGAIVLMAGYSSRMEGGNKLFMSVGESAQSVAERTLHSVVNGGYNPIVVVTGHDAETLKSTLMDFDVQYIHNVRYTDGMGTSIATAVQHIRDWDAALIVLGDMPFVATQTFQALLDKSLENPNQIIAPTFNARRGQPVIFPARFFDELKRCTGDVGGKRVLKANSDSVILLEVDDEGIHWDVDTMEMLRLYSLASQEVTDD